MGDDEGKVQVRGEASVVDIDLLLSFGKRFRYPV